MNTCSLVAAIAIAASALASAQTIDLSRTGGSTCARGRPDHATDDIGQQVRPCSRRHGQTPCDLIRRQQPEPRPEHARQALDAPDFRERPDTEQSRSNSRGSCVRDRRHRRRPGTALCMTREECPVREGERPSALGSAVLLRIGWSPTGRTETILARHGRRRIELSFPPTGEARDAVGPRCRRLASKASILTAVTDSGPNEVPRRNVRASRISPPREASAVSAARPADEIEGGSAARFARSRCAKQVANRYQVSRRAVRSRKIVRGDEGRRACRV